MNTSTTYLYARVVYNKVNGDYEAFLAIMTEKGYSALQCLFLHKRCKSEG